jgi:hypothetical protein
MGLAAVLGICTLAPTVGTGQDSLYPLYEGAVVALEVAPVAPGARGELSVLLEEEAEPGVLLRLALWAEGVELPENRLSWRDVVDPQAAQLRLRGSFVAPSEPGEYRIEGLVSYVHCAGDWCRTKHAPVSWTIRVEPTLAAD